MSLNVASPRLTVQVYPYEGGAADYTLTSSEGVLLAATVHKSIRGSDPGTFQLVLAPGGPQGVASPKTWTEIFTPMSLVILTGSRGVFVGPLMVGVVHAAAETQEWDAEEGVSRTITITGYDFQYFFSHRSYYTLTFLGSSAASALKTYYGSLALPAILGKGVVGGSPDKVGASWFNEIMAGKDGIMSQTAFPYRNNLSGQPDMVSFTDLMTQAYESYPSADLIIPLAENFLSVEGSWYDKFAQIFPFPFYEFFVITAPQGAYKTPDAYVAPAAQTFTGPEVPSSFPQTAMAFGPTLVARVNPLPTLQYLNGQWTMDTTRWNALPLYSLGEKGATQYGFVESGIEFTDAEARNFFLIVPTTLSMMMGQSGGQNSPYVYTNQALVDVASIHRYGYRPEIVNTYWLADVTGDVSVVNAARGGDFQALVSEMMNRLGAYHEPAPLMARAEIKSIFRPDILPGNRFTYAPFRNNEAWEFYIEAIDHTYRFGGETTTTLSLSRGLPQALYNHSPPGLLTAVHTGMAERREGVYGLKVAPKSPGLTILNIGDSHTILGQIAQVFNTPGAN